MPVGRGLVMWKPKLENLHPMYQCCCLIASTYPLRPVFHHCAVHKRDHYPPSIHSSITSDINTYAVYVPCYSCSTLAFPAASLGTVNNALAEDALKLFLHDVSRRFSLCAYNGCPVTPEHGARLTSPRAQSKSPLPSRCTHRSLTEEYSRTSMPQPLSVRDR